MSLPVSPWCNVDWPDLVQATIAIVSSQVQQSYHTQKIPLHLSSPRPLSLIISVSSSVMVPEPWGRGWVRNVPFVAEHSTGSYSFPFGKLWVSVLTATHCTDFSDEVCEMHWYIHSPSWFGWGKGIVGTPFWYPGDSFHGCWAGSETWKEHSLWITFFFFSVY